MQYYNRSELKKSLPNGLERTGTDTGAEAFRVVVYCGRKNYSDKQMDGQVDIYPVRYPLEQTIR